LSWRSCKIIENNYIITLDSVRYMRIIGIINNANGDRDERD
jgi:hypothetical protein